MTAPTAWRMPAETSPQDRVWMAFPPGGYALGESEEEAHAARSTWAAVANAVVEFEPVTVVVAPGDEEVAREYLVPSVSIEVAPLDDAWMRDIGPTFVLGDDGRLGAVDWVFNGWGQQDWATWEKDALIGRFVADKAGAELISTPLVGEGGGLNIDDHGTVFLTETVQLDPLRNPGWTADQVEEEIARVLGTTHAVWLPRGLTRDSERFGTKGHVDIVATIPSSGTLLLHAQPDPSHPDHAVMKELRAVIDASVDARGEHWNVIEVPAPTVLKDDEGYVDYSYINHLVVNGGVIACSFDDPRDAEAVEILAAAYPGRRIVTVDARELFARGGGIHCITQQQPSR